MVRSYICNLTYFGKRSFHCVMHVVKLVSMHASHDLYQFQSKTFAALPNVRWKRDGAVQRVLENNISPSATICKRPLTGIFCQTNFLSRCRYFRNRNVGGWAPKFSFTGASASPAPPPPPTRLSKRTSHEYKRNVLSCYPWMFDGLQILSNTTKHIKTRSNSTKEGVQTVQCLVTKQRLMVFGRQTFIVCPSPKFLIKCLMAFKFYQTRPNTIKYEHCLVTKHANVEVSGQTVKVLLRSNSRYPFFYIFLHNRCVQDILPNFNLLRKTELVCFEPLFPRIYGRL